MHLNDRVSVDGVNRTRDGYLAATARVARTGIQVYTGAEVGKPEMPTVRVFRPEAEVFADATMRSFAHRPMTLDHPSFQVSASNWKDVAIGNTGSKVHRDGDFIVVDLVMMDAAAIRAYEGGQRELSMGYDCELDFTPGTAPSGEKYDAIQRNIRNNHLALVGRARGGSQLRVGDGAAEDHLQDTAEGRYQRLVMDRAQEAQPNVPQHVVDAQRAHDAHVSQVLAAKDAALADQLQHLADQHAQINAHAERFSAQYAARDAAARADPREAAYQAMCDDLDYFRRQRG